MVVNAGGLSYRYTGSGTAISDLPGWVPVGIAGPKHWGAVGDGATDDRAALNAMFTYAFSNGRHVKLTRGDYYTSAALTDLYGGNWVIEGDGAEVTYLRTAGDYTGFNFSVAAFNANYVEISGIQFIGNNAGSHVTSAGILVKASTGSETGLKYFNLHDCIFAGTRYGVFVHDTGKTVFSGYDSITCHGYWNVRNNFFVPNGTMEYGFYAEGAFGLHSKFVGNQFRGTEAAVRLGSGAALVSIGDLVFVGNEFLSGEVGIILNGPSTAGAYNQNILISGNQFDNLTVNTIQATNLKNFRFYPNNSTASVGVSLTNCTDYVVEDRGDLTFAGSARSHLWQGTIELEGDLIFDDANGPRYTNAVLARRNVNTGNLKVAGGNVSNAGATIDLYGGAHATLANNALIDGDRVRIRSQNGATNLIDANAAAGTITVGSGAWNGVLAKFGSYFLWVDGSGRLRIKSSAPASDTDGTVVGTQV